MSEVVIRNDSQLHRWAISAAAVLLMHGAILAALLKWPRSEPTGPVIIDLPPLPVPLVDQQPPLEAGTPSQSVEKIEEAAQQEFIGGSEVKLDQSRAEQPSGAAAALLPAPVALGSGGGANGTGAGAAGRVGAPGSMAAIAGPIDTSIAGTRLSERPGSRFSRAAKASGWKGPTDWRKPFIIVRPANPGVVRPANPFMIVRPANPGLHQQAHGSSSTVSMGSPGTAGGITRNALGLPLQGPAGAKQPPAVEHQMPQANAIAAKGTGGAATNAVNGMTTNAIGMTVVSHPSGAAAGANPAVVPAHPGVAGANPALAAVHPGMTGSDSAAGIVHIGTAGNAASNASLNGTNMVRPGARVGVLGGPAKNVGVVSGLNGTAFTPRHP